MITKWNFFIHRQYVSDSTFRQSQEKAIFISVASWEYLVNCYVKEDAELHGPLEL